MDNKSNFERAKKLTDSWPSWKRDYQLTKNSENKQETSDDDRQIVQCSDRTRNAASQMRR